MYPTGDDSQAVYSGRFGAVIAPAALCLVFAGLAGGCGPGEDGPAGQVHITHPEDGQLVTEDRFRVRGTADGLQTITVGDQSTAVVGGKWEVLIDFDEGPQSVRASGGGASHNVDFTVDSHAPDLQLQSPEHALYVEKGESDAVTVSGSVSDSGTGLRAVSIQNGVVQTDEQGRFHKDVALEPGQNTIGIRAVDEAGNAATATRSVMHGSFVAPDSLIDPGLNIHVTTSAAAEAETVIETYLTPERVTGLIKKQVQNENLSVQSVDFDDFNVDIAFKDEVVGLTANVKGLALRADLAFSKEAKDPIPLQIGVDTFTIIADIKPEADQENGLSFNFENTQLKLEQQDVQISVVGENGSEDLDRASVRKMVVNLAERSFERMLTDELIDRLWDPSVLKRRIEVLGRELVFEVVPTGVSVTPGDELFVQTAVSMPADKWPELAEVPGALELPVSGPGAGDEPLEADTVINTSRMALDRIVHGVWRSGLLHQQLKGNDFAGMELPIELNAGALAFAVDGRITELADGATPAAIRLRPLMPPTVDFEGGDSDSESSGNSETKLGMTIGEMMVDLVLLPEDQAPIEVATIAVFLDLSVQVGVDGIQLDLQFEADASADIVEEPEFDLDDSELESVIADLMELVPDLIEEELTIAGQRDLTWVTLKNPKLGIRGEDDDRVSAGIDVKANPEGVESGE